MMEHGKPIIYVKNVRKVYRMGDEEVVALKRINLKIYKGEVCCIFGTSGSGKSTLLNQLAGMEKPTQGQVFIRGKSISRMDEEELAAFRQEHMSFIFQSYNLLPSMTAVENVAMPLMFKGVDRKRREAMAEDLLRRVGLSHRLHHYPSQMSGGQQQRRGLPGHLYPGLRWCLQMNLPVIWTQRQQRRSWTWSWDLPEDSTRPSYW